MATTASTADIKETPGATIEQPEWWTDLVREGAGATAAEPITLLLGAPVRDMEGGHLGRIRTLGLGIGAQQLTAVGTERALYPASAIVEGDPDGGVVIDASRRARIVVSREITPSSRAWSADGIDFRAAGVVVDSEHGRLRHLLVRRHRRSPLLQLAWALVYAEPDGLALRMAWRQAADHVPVVERQPDARRTSVMLAGCRGLVLACRAVRRPAGLLRALLG